MKPFSLLLLALPMFGLVSCQTPSLDSIPSDEETWTPPEQQGSDFVDINGEWRLKARALDVQRDESSKRLVLVAGAQEGAVLTSLRAPRQTRVATKGTANAIYYDAYQNRFELVGDPVVEQGTLVTRKFGSTAKILMYGDGDIIKDPPPKPVSTES